MSLLLFLRLLNLHLSWLCSSLESFNHILKLLEISISLRIGLNLILVSLYDSISGVTVVSTPALLSFTWAAAIAKSALVKGTSWSSTLGPMQLVYWPRDSEWLCIVTWKCVPSSVESARCAQTSVIELILIHLRVSEFFRTSKHASISVLANIPWIWGLQLTLIKHFWLLNT